MTMPETRGTETMRATQPGDIVVTDFGAYQHWSLVSDTHCKLGKPMLISATRRSGTVREESWDLVTQGKQTYVTATQHPKTTHQVLSDARAMIDRWNYSVTTQNCEHFIKQITGLSGLSSQVMAGAAGAVAGAVLVGLLSEKPKLIKYVGAAALLAELAVIASKAPKAR
jgi:hypothetical protein